MECSGASGTQRRGTPHYGVALRSSVEALRCSKLVSQISIASGTPRRSEVFFFIMGVLKSLIFWTIDGLESRDIKGKQF